METLTCTIKDIRYQNPENGFSVLSVLFDGHIINETLVVKIIEPTIGTCLKVTGEWIRNSKFGMQFSASDWEEVLPTTKKGIEAYLSSGLIKGVGPVYAKKIVDYFGEKAIEVLENTPERLMEIKGLGTKKYEMIVESWKKSSNIRNLMMFFKQYDLSTRLIIKINNLYGEDAINVVKENPYTLISIEGIGFKTADRIALNLGFDMESPRRIEAGISYTIQAMCDDGDSFVYPKDLLYETSNLLEVDEELITPVISDMVDGGDLVDCNGKIYLYYIYNSEVNVAGKIRQLLHTTPHTRFMKTSIDDLESRTGYKYDELQIKAIQTAIDNNVMVLTGGPGTGKTTTTKGIIEMLTGMGLTIILAAPTGKAAKKMSETTGREAKTIHRLLEYNPATGCAYNEYAPLPYDVVIVDECSMINIMLMSTLMSAIAPTTKVIMIGDIDQLPAIGPGNVLGDIIDSETVPVIKLNRIFRQAQDSNIIMNAHRIKNGEPIVVSNKKDSDFFVIECRQDVIEETVDLVKRRLPLAYDCEPLDVQVLTPMKKCTVGVDNLNVALQDALNPDRISLKRGKYEFREGDKVIQTVNNYEKDVFNGDGGFITKIDLDEKIVHILFDDRELEYTYPEMEEIQLAYAMTIHKSQGSEYKIVVIPITYANKIMMERNLIYTAITRAKEICVIIGEKRMVDLAIGNVSNYERNTMLKERIQNVA